MPTASPGRVAVVRAVVVRRIPRAGRDQRLPSACSHSQNTSDEIAEYAPREWLSLVVRAGTECLVRYLAQRTHHSAARAGVATYPTGSLESAAGWAGCSVSCPAAVEAVEQFAGVGVGLGHAELAGHGDLGLDVIGHAGEAHRERCWLW